MVDVTVPVVITKIVVTASIFMLTINIVVIQTAQLSIISANRSLSLTARHSTFLRIREIVFVSVTIQISFNLLPKVWFVQIKL